MYNDKTTSLPQTNFRMLHESSNKIKKGRRISIHELVGLQFRGIAFCNLSALFLNSANKSIRLVAEDVGVLKSLKESQLLMIIQMKTKIKRSWETKSTNFILLK